MDLGSVGPWVNVTLLWRGESNRGKFSGPAHDKGSGEMLMMLDNVSFKSFE